MGWMECQPESRQGPENGSRTTISYLKDEIFNMTLAWDKEKSESPTGIEPMTSQTPGGRSIHSATRTHGEHWVHMWQVSCILLGSALPNSSWVVISPPGVQEVGARFLSGTHIFLCPTLVSCWIFHLSHLITELKIHHLHSLITTSYICYYYSFKIFPRFWLVKTTRIIHHNQLLFTKFGKNLRHIESMTSKVEPSKNYWTIDVKMTSKVQPAADYWTVDRENLGTRLCYIWWAEKQRVKWRNSFKNE